jgi:hypothetical protein
MALKHRSSIIIPLNNPISFTIEVARFVETGGGTPFTVGRMNDEYLGYNRRGIITDPAKWEKGFRDQTGRNVNEAINGLAKIYAMLGQ